MSLLSQNLNGGGVKSGFEFQLLRASTKWCLSWEHALQGFLLRAFRYSLANVNTYLVARILQYSLF